MLLSRRQMIALPLSLAACARRPRASEPIRVLAMPYFHMASLYLADEFGYFAKEGLRVDIQSAQSSRRAIPLLAEGQADAAFFAINPALINAVERGARVRVVAGRRFYSTECAASPRLYGSRQAFPNGFNDIRQMRGKKVSSGRESTGIGAFLFDQYLAAAQLTRDDMQVVSVDERPGAALLVDGKLDAVLGHGDFDLSLTPFRDRLVTGPTAASVLPNFMYSYVFFGERLLDGPPRDGAGFLRAYLRGCSDFLAGKTPRFVDEVARTNGYSAEFVRQACRGGLAADGRIQLGDLQRFIDWSVERGLTPTAVRAEQLVDGRFRT